MARFGGTRSDWLDLSTGINPVPYPLPPLPDHAWTALPDSQAQTRLIQAARRFWRVPNSAQIVPAPGASALIARLPPLTDAPDVHIPGPTYNEHEAAFRAAGRTLSEDASVRVVVHPNNPDGRLTTAQQLDMPAGALTIIDESFCDLDPDQSHIARTARPGTIILKSFGKFWGLAGLRLGFAIGDTKDLAQLLGPWPVSGPALHIGAGALNDTAWAAGTRVRLAQDAAHLDTMMSSAGAGLVGGTSLFRLYDVPDAVAWHDRLARKHILTRIFPYSKTWLRLGLPHPDKTAQLARVLDGMAGGATT